MKNDSFLEQLVSRRSVRSYTAESVEREELDAILTAGLYAPSGMGRQNTILVCVTKKETRDILSKLNAQIIGNDSDPFYGAPAVIAVLADNIAPTFVEDGALVLGNMLNEASARGLGACWIHRARQVFELPEGKQLLAQWKIPESYKGIGFCIVGHADIVKPAAARRDGRIISID
jgi:nitroreductase